MTSQPFFVPALIFAVLALPLILGVVPKNPVYGVRTKRSMSSPDVWKRVNRRAGWGVLAASGIYLVVADLYPYSPTMPDDLTRMLIHLGAFVVPLFLALLTASRFLETRA